MPNTKWVKLACLRSCKSLPIPLSSWKWRFFTGVRRDLFFVWEHFFEYDECCKNVGYVVAFACRESKREWHLKKKSRFIISWSFPENRECLLKNVGIYFFLFCEFVFICINCFYATRVLQAFLNVCDSFLFYCFSFEQ